MKIILFLLTHLVLAALLSTTAHGQSSGWYVAQAVVYTDDDNFRKIDDSVGGGQMTVGRAISEHFSLEGLLGYSEFGGFPGQKHWEASFNVLAFINRDRTISPYLLAGVGYLGTDLDNAGEENRPTAIYGIGFTWALGDGSVSIRAEHRARVALESNFNLTDRISSLGLQFSIGGRTKSVFDGDGDGIPDRRDRCRGTSPGVEVDSTGCELDRDGDGVIYLNDACPDTPAGVRVDSTGCAPRDRDRDGVTDDKDQCPRTVAGAAVDVNGCELDSDGDDVVNRLDKCPNTTVGVRVDVNGCEIRDVIELPGVNFASNTDRLLPGAEQVLTNAVATLRKYPNLLVEVAGHTDSDGSAAYNEGLSARRANTVRDYMINAGVDLAQLSAKGYGETMPISSNASAQGKAANRRVELRILNR